jgi:hypothetical protein
MNEDTTAALLQDSEVGDRWMASNRDNVHTSWQNLPPARRQAGVPTSHPAALAHTQRGAPAARAFRRLCAVAPAVARTPTRTPPAQTSRGRPGASCLRCTWHAAAGGRRAFCRCVRCVREHRRLWRCSSNTEQHSTSVLSDATATPDHARTNITRAPRRLLPPLHLARCCWWPSRVLPLRALRPGTPPPVAVQQQHRTAQHVSSE